MLELSQKAKYALTLLAFLANQDSQNSGVFLSLKSIASQTGLPYRFLSLIAVDLKNAGILDSKEGKSGGYFLKQDLTKISLKKLVEAVDKPVGLVACQMGRYCGNQEYCRNRGKWDQIRDEVAEVLSKYKVNEII